MTECEYREVYNQEELDDALTADNVIPCCVGDASFEVKSDSNTVVEVYGPATVTVYGSATVRAYNSATVRAYNSATVTAYNSATVRAYNSATVTAYNSATVTASKFVTVHKHSPCVSINGGVVIEVPDWTTADIDTWAEYTGAQQDRETATVTVYKAVDQNFKSNYGAFYRVGSTVVADDWEGTRNCGQGLHFSQTPRHAWGYCRFVGNIRFLECRVLAAKTVVLGHDKIKAQACTVVREVDIEGNALAEEGIENV